MTPAWTELRPHKQQSQLWRTEARFPIVVAGRGSGKTELSRRYIVRMLPVRKPWPDPIYIIAFPTYSQAKRVVWDKVKALIPKDWLPKNGANMAELTFRTIFGSTLYIVGMDKPFRIEGMQIDGCIMDESSDQKPEAFTRTILPMLSHRNGFCWRIGKPKRTGIGASAFRKSFLEGLQPNDKDLESYNWKSNTVLTEEQLHEIAGQMGAEEYAEEVNAEWTDAKGGIFYAYNDTENVSANIAYNPNAMIGVGSDFNVDPMAWVLFHVVNGVMYVFDELWIRDTNTQNTLNELYRRYGQHKAGWHFFGDASSRNRHTSTSMTDFLQIINDKRFANAKISYPKANPAVSDRFAATNALLCNALNERRCFIHPKCKNLREDLQQRTYKEGTRDVNDSGDIGHITDALGYPIYKLFPIRLGQDGNAKVSIKVM